MTPPFDPDVLREFVRQCDQSRFSYALTGGAALAFYGEPRATFDLDFLIDGPAVALPGLLEGLARRGFHDPTGRALMELTQDRFTHLTRSGRVVDLMLPVLPIFAEAIREAREFTLHGSQVRVVSARHLILLKSLAMREQDAGDIRRLLASQFDSIDGDEIVSALAAILPEEDERVATLRKIAAEMR